MAIREAAAIIPATLNLRDHSSDARKLATHLEGTLAPICRAVSLCADWVEHRQIAITASYEIIDETAIFADAAEGAVVVTLPASSSETINRDVHVKKTDSSSKAVTIAPRGTDTIDGAASIIITTPGESFHLLADGLGKWRVLSTVAASGPGGVVMPATATPIIVNLTAGAVGTSIKYAREDHRHLFDVTIDPTGANAWTGVHAWAPDSNAVPITVNKTASLTSAGLLRVLDTDTTPLVVVDNAGFVGINCEPDVYLTIQGTAGVNPDLLGWYKGDTYIGVLSDAQNMTTWTDLSGNGNTLTAGGVDGTNNAIPIAGRPRWFGTGSSGFTNLAGVSFFTQIGHPNEQTEVRFFTFTNPPTLTTATGWTVFVILREFLDINGNRCLMGGNSAPKVIGIEAGGASTERFFMGTNTTPAYFSSPFAHTDGNDNEVIVLRCSATGVLDCYIDGVPLTSSVTDPLASRVLNYLGRFDVGAASAGMPGNLVAELAILGRPATNGEMAAFSTYGLARVAGTSATFPISTGISTDLTRWKDSTATTLSRIDSAGQFGFGVAPAVPVHIVNASEQLRIGTSTTHYTGFVYAGSAAITYTLPATSTTGVLHNLAATLSWAAVSLTADVTGVLPVANGGTNSGTALSGSSIMISNGTAIVQGAAGTATTVLHGNASGAPTYSAVLLTADVTGTLPVSNGGTGIATLAAGSLVYGAGTSAFVPLAIGTAAQLLQVNSGATAPQWSTASGDATVAVGGAITLASVITAGGPVGDATHVPTITWDAKGRLLVVTSTAITGVPATAHNLLSATHGDTTASTVVRGDLVTGQGASSTWDNLALGASGTLLRSDGTDVTWASLATAGIAASSVTLTAGAGLTGGGDLSANRTFDVGAGTGITVNANDVALTVPVVLANGGTNAGLTASNGGIVYSTASALAILAGTATAGQILRSGASAAPTWSTATYPATAGTVDRVLASDGTNFVTVTIQSLGAITGSLTAPQLPRASSGSGLVDSRVSDNTSTGIILIPSTASAAYDVSSIKVLDGATASSFDGAGGIDIKAGDKLGVAGDGLDLRLIPGKKKTSGLDGVVRFFNPTANVAAGVSMVNLTDNRLVKFQDIPGTLAYFENKLSVFAATTSAELAGVISDETGSGLLVFATSPTLTTPSLGVATATTINKITLTQPATGSTLTIADGKTFTVNQTLTLTGTSGTTMTFPTTTATIARTDVAQTFTGSQTVLAAATQDAIALAGRAGGTGSFVGTLTPTTLSASRTYTFKDSSGTVAFTSDVPVAANPTTATVGTAAVNGSAATFMRSDAAPPIDLTMAPVWTGQHTFNNAGPFEFGGTGSAADGLILVAASTAKSAGLFFNPVSFTGSGQTLFSQANVACGLYARVPTVSSATPTLTKIVGGIFETTIGGAIGANIDDAWGAWFRPNSTTPSGNSTRTTARMGGFKVFTAQIGKNSGTFTDLYGGYISDMSATTTGATNFTLTNEYGLYIEEQTRAATIKNGIFLANATAGYKAIAIRDQNTWIGSSAAATLDLQATTVLVTADMKLSTAGNGLYIKEGTNATSGTAVLVLGTVVVNTTKVTANSRIQLTAQALGTVAVAQALAVTARTAGTSFTITSANATDTSTVAWVIVEPA